VAHESRAGARIRAGGREAALTLSPPPPTIAAIATPPGRGGIGIVRVSGADLERVIDGIVGKQLSPRVATSATFRDAAGAALDAGLALFFAAPNSYTGENVLELHGHGSPAALRLLLARCVELGARIAAPGELTKRAFLNGKLDLAQAEAVADLIDAATSTAARAAMKSLTGEFSRDVQSIVTKVTELRMYTEATLDFPEEDVDFLRAHDASGRVEAIRGELARLLARAQSGALLREGLTVVLIGRPNVGKSSLLNRLVREEAAIVTPIAGTTRDTVERGVELAGIPLTVIDTAGLRATRDEVERVGIERTWAAVERADLAILIVDARDAIDTLDAADAALLARLSLSLPRIIVHNKADLACALPHVETRFAADIARRHIWLSAFTGAGIDLLEHEVLSIVGAHGTTEDAFLARERHLVALRDAADHLALASCHMADDSPPLELFAEELREAQQALGSITGEFSADDLLGVIFSRFCIGK
jgi:tRNA modification GTPase